MKRDQLPSHQNHWSRTFPCSPSSLNILLLFKSPRNHVILRFHTWRRGRRDNWLGSTCYSCSRERPGQPSYPERENYQVHCLLFTLLTWTLCLTLSREIKASQEGLQGSFSHQYSFQSLINQPFFVLSECGLCLTAMLAKVQAVQREVDQLMSSNEMLQMYIDNLTKQMAQRR